MPLGGVLFRELPPFAFFRHHLYHHWTLDMLYILKNIEQQGQVMSIERAKKFDT